MEAGQGKNKESKNVWLISGLISIFLLSLFWSVDASFFYFFAAIAVFCFFQYFRSGVKVQWKKEEPPQWEREEPPQYKKYQFQSGQFGRLFKEINKEFSASSGEFKGRVFGKALMGIFSIIFLVAFCDTLFSDDVLNFPDSYYRGNEFIEAGQYDSAAYYYRLASLENPDDPEIYFVRGSAFSYMKNYDSAVILFNKVLALDSIHNDAQYAKGYALYQLQRYKEAIDATSKIMEYNPSDLNAMLLIGDSYYTMGQHESALQWYTSAYDGGYRGALLSHLMAYIYDTQGKSAEAIKFYQEAIGLDSSKVEIYTRLGELMPGEDGNFYRKKAMQFSQESN